MWYDIYIYVVRQLRVKGGKRAEGVREQGAEGDNRGYEQGGNRKLEKTALQTEI